MGEFDLIQRFFKTGADAMHPQQAIALGIGDDCALIHPAANEEMAITTDMLVEGRHFFVGANPELLGSKALAVNLSDLAAMGATPLGFTLALALPSVDQKWLEAFSKGLFSIAKQYSCSLIGGDTTSGPLTISITAFGSMPTGKAIRRSGAKPGTIFGFQERLEMPDWHLQHCVMKSCSLKQISNKLSIACINPPQGLN